MESKPPQPNARSIEMVQLTLEEKKFVQWLENFNFISPSYKVQIILTLRKFKKATECGIEVESNVFSENLQVNRLKEKIEKMGMLFKDMGRIIDNVYTDIYGDGIERRTCIIAYDQASLDQFSKLWIGDHEKNPEVYKGIGRMSGFPETAIATFDELIQFLPNKNEKKIKNKRRSLFLSVEEKKELVPAEIYPFFLFFMFSRKHWKSESETVRRWTEEVKLISLRIYDQFINFTKEQGRL